MGVFSRFKDIVNSNISSILDKAEDPKKLIRLMIQEMEETLTEMKAATAQTMADAKEISRNLAFSLEQANKWASRAALAVEKGKDELAKEALIEKNAYLKRAEELEGDLQSLQELISQSQQDIAELEDKLQGALAKQQLLIERQTHAVRRKKAGGVIRKASNIDSLIRFEEFEKRIDRMEFEADLINKVQTSATSTEDTFVAMEENHALNEELQALKSKIQAKTD